MYFCCPFKECFLLEQIKASNSSDVLNQAYTLFEEGAANEAHNLLRKLVIKKDKIALVLSALFSFEEENEQEFYRRHLSNLEAAAASQSSLAIYSLAVYYDTGQFFQENKSKAYEYFKKAAELGMPQAMHIYGVMLYYGTGGASRDELQGISMVKLAAKHCVNEASEFLRYIGEYEK